MRAKQSKARRPQRCGAVQRLRAAVVAAPERRAHQRQLTDDPVVMEVFGLHQGLRQHACTGHTHSFTVRRSSHARHDWADIESCLQRELWTPASLRVCRAGGQLQHHAC